MNKGDSIQGTIHVVVSMMNALFELREADGDKIRSNGSGDFKLL